MIHRVTENFIRVVPLDRLRAIGEYINEMVARELEAEAVALEASKCD